MTWVFYESEEKLGCRLVLLALADCAHDDGSKAFPTVKTIAGKSRMSERQVQENLRKLEASGAIVKTGVTRAGVNIYRVVMGAVSAPAVSSEGGADSAGSTRETAPDSSEPPMTLQSMEGAREQLPPAYPLSEVDKRKVTRGEAQLSLEVLRIFNEAAGTKFSSKELLAKIVRRLREHPEVDENGHRQAITGTLGLTGRDKWWSGSPGPEMIYGNPTAFERALNRVPQAEQTDWGFNG